VNPYIQYYGRHKIFLKMNKFVAVGCLIVTLMQMGCDEGEQLLALLAHLISNPIAAERAIHISTEPNFRGNEVVAETVSPTTTSGAVTHTLQHTPMCIVDPLGSLSEIPGRPPFAVIRELGRGQTGTVFAVELPDGRQAALKCACVSGRFLLNDYGALLDLQSTGYVPRVWGYYKRPSEGDCFFMSLLGPSLREVRRMTYPRQWPPQTIASIGLRMLSAIEAFALPENGYILHRDAFVGNVVLGPPSSDDNHISTELYFIDFDLSKRKYIARDFYPEVRQVLYTLRFLFDGDEASPYFQIVDHRSCHGKFSKNCSPAHPKLCQAIEYACSFDGVRGKNDEDPAQEMDLGKIRSYLRSMMDDDHIEDHKIFWPEWIRETYSRTLGNTTR
jgi:hypothetical protein